MPTVALNSKSALAGAGPSNLKVRPGDRKKAGKKGPHASKTRRVHDRKELQTLEDAVKNFVSHYNFDVEDMVLIGFGRRFQRAHEHLRICPSHPIPRRVRSSHSQ